MRLEEDIETLSRAILREAEVDAQEVKQEAQAKADAIRQRAKEDAEKVRKEILDQARQEADRLRSQTLASAQLKARTLQLEQREKLLNRVFEEARRKLPEVQKTPDYDKLVAQLLREALVQLKADKATVRADAITQKILKDGALSALAKEMNADLSLGATLEEGIGVIVDASGGHLHFDNTLETRLKRMQSPLRSSVHHILMGEKV